MISLLVASATLLSTCQTHRPVSPSILGTWRLLSYEARDATGTVQFPLGETVAGQLIYDSAGNMSAHVMATDRPRFASADPAGGTDLEVRTAFERFVSYFGTYTFDGRQQTITHHVQAASYPNWSGDAQLRHYRFEGPRLVLRTPAILRGGQSLEFVLTWERIR
jgi:hypothetical protein